MARSIGGLVKSAVGSVAQMPGAEDIVLQAVRDIFTELKQLRRENDKLHKQVERLEQRLAGGAARPTRSSSSRSGSKTASRKPATKRATKRTPAKRTSTKRRAPKRGGGFLSDLLG